MALIENIFRGRQQFWWETLGKSEEQMVFVGEAKEVLCFVGNDRRLQFWWDLLGKVEVLAGDTSLGGRRWGMLHFSRMTLI